MPKRKRDSDKYILKKLRKLEKKLKKRRRRSLSSDESVNSLESPSRINDSDSEIEESAELSAYNENIENELPELDNETDVANNVETTLQTKWTGSDVPSTSTNTDEASVLEDTILKLLGEAPSKENKYGSAIQDELAVRWEHIATKGLNKETKKDILQQYNLPENCTKIGAPKLNPEIKAALSDALQKKDSVIYTKQNQQALALTCVSHALTKILKSDNKDSDVIKWLVDASKLLCDSQYVESMSRRSFVTSTIKKEIKDQLYTTEIDSFLFGEQLADTLKNAKAINKSGADMKTPFKANNQQNRFKSQPLNLRSPLPTARQVGSGRKFTPAMQQPRRYQTVHPSPPQQPFHQNSRNNIPLPAPQPRHSRGRMQTRR